MHFPLRLAANLSFAFAGRAFCRDKSAPLVLHTDAAELSGCAGNAQVQIQNALDARAVWITGDDPLTYTDIPRIAHELIAHGPFVFLQTPGSLVGRRVHEFRPVSRFFFAIPLGCSQDAVALEALRRVKLSGFLTCAYTQISLDTSFANLQQLRERLRALDVDGWVISGESRDCPSVSHHPLVQQKLEGARQRIPSWGWRAFSAYLDAAQSLLPVIRPLEQKLTQDLPATRNVPAQQAESAGAP